MKPPVQHFVARLPHAIVLRDMRAQPQSQKQPSVLDPRVFEDGDHGPLGCRLGSGHETLNVGYEGAGMQQQHGKDKGIKALYGVSGSGTRLDASPTESGENIAKLRERFPDAYSNEAAEARADKGGLDARVS